MPPWQGVEPTEKTCLLCGASYFAKRESAKYCSALCLSRSRPKRVRDPERHKRWYANLTPEQKRANLDAQNVRIRKVKDWLAAYKLARGCVDCGYKAHHVALDFDHMDGKTKNLAEMTSIRAAQAEIERHGCVIRCANCHRVKSFETQTWIRA